MVIPKITESVTTKLGFIGGGNMAEVILKVVIFEGFAFGKNIFVTDVNAERRQYLDQTTGARVLQHNSEVLRRSSIVLFAVKPQNMNDVMAEVKEAGTPDHLFLSICAGTPTTKIEAGLKTENNPEPRVIRIMPNTPAMIGQGVAGICKGQFARDEDLDFPFKVFNAVGAALKMPEEMMDAVTGLTGSGPAYVFYLIESLVEAGIKVGFTEDQSKEMVLQMVLGSATLAFKSDRSPAELRRAVTSPGGTTQAGFEVMKDRKIKEALIDTVEAATKRSKELSTL
jgi:pyrroline-5-carboxylate reductase